MCVFKLHLERLTERSPEGFAFMIREICPLSLIYKFKRVARGRNLNSIILAANTWFLYVSTIGVFLLSIFVSDFTLRFNL